MTEASTARRASRHGTRASVRRPLAWLSAVVLIGVGAVAVSVASASDCTPIGSLQHTGDQITAFQPTLAEGASSTHSWEITGCDLTLMDALDVDVSFSSSDTSALTAATPTGSDGYPESRRFTATSDTAGRYNGRVLLTAPEDSDSDNETVTVTITPTVSKFKTLSFSVVVTDND